MLGKFIAFEGGEGTGKSTQSELLRNALVARGISVVLTREPGGTAGAEAIRELLLAPPGNGWNSKAEALLFAAARSDHVANLIRPALERGDWVISDRFVDSSRAYQGGAGGLGDAYITQLHELGSEGFRPDLTVLIDVAPEAIAERLAARDKGQSDAIGGRSAAYHAAVAEHFRAFAEADAAGFVMIDGNGDPDTIYRRVADAISERLGIPL